MYTLPFIQNGTLFKSQGEIFIRGRAVTPQCYGCTKTLASHEHVHHLIHKHHTMMNVIISCVFLFELLGFMLAIVCAPVWFMQICVNVLVNNLATLRMSLGTMFMLTILSNYAFKSWFD